jgi:dihydroxyacid dehydratase/phosphogluconate dehydratase
MASSRSATVCRCRPTWKPIGRHVQEEQDAVGGIPTVMKYQLEAGRINKGDVVVIRYEGPKGGAVIWWAETVAAGAAPTVVRSPSEMICSGISL